MSRSSLALAAIVLLLTTPFVPSTDAVAASKKAAPVIDNFTVDPANQTTPGTEINFVVEGTAKGKASVRIPGVPRTISLREVDDGVYEGSYTVRSNDKIAVNAPVRSTLTRSGRSAVATVALRAAAAAAATTPTAPAPAAAAAPTIERFNVSPVDKLEPGVDLKFTLTGTPGGRASVGIEGVTRDIDMKEVKPGQYEASYTVRRSDNFPAAGNVFARLESGGQTTRARLQQSLLVAAKPAAPAAMPLDITSHQNNAQIAGGATEVRGRTAPNAHVDVKVTQTASVAGLFGVNQELLSQTVRADANGNFAFRFQPQINVPGARYDMGLKARNDQGQSRDMQLVLFQQK